MTRPPTWARAFALISLTALGCSATEEDLASTTQALDTPPLVARSSTLDFGAVAVGSTSTRRVTLLNNGTDVVDITRVLFVSAFPPDPCRAVVLQPCIRPGETTTLEVTCTPSVAGAFGGRVYLAYESGADDRGLAVSVTGQATFSTR